jgi:nucleoside-diphosphate-sugar epimerase
VSRTRALDSRVEVHSADLHDERSVRRLVAEIQPSHLLHLAWYTEHGAFWNSDENLRWVSSSLNLLRAFNEAGGRRAVIASTCAEYEWLTPTLIEDETPRRPRTLYGASKGALHDLALQYARAQPLDGMGPRFLPVRSG